MKYDFERDESLKFLTKFGKKRSQVRFKTEHEAVDFASEQGTPAYVFSLPLHILVFENAHSPKYRKK